MQADERPSTPSTPAAPGNRLPAWLFVLVAAVIATSSGIVWWLNRAAPEVVVEQAPQAPATAPAPTPPAVQHPIEQAAVAVPAEPVVPLPALGESDPMLFEALAGLLADDGWRRLLAGDFLIQRFVATVDNLPRRKLAPHLLPVRSAAGTLQATGQPGAMELAPTNFARYDSYIGVLAAVDAPKLVALYVRLYPLFQQAYRETGQAEGYFNDRLVAVLDHLIAAPAPEGPILLVRPKVFWEFADPALEEASAGEKLMIRIGPGHAATVRAKLGEIRALLVAAPPAN